MTETTEPQPNYEQQFAHRFSTEDSEYQDYLKQPVDTPPIVEDWSGRGGGNGRGRGGNRYHDHRGHRGRGWGGDHHRQQQWQDRERRWGHGSGHHSGSHGYNQEYNSYNQRPRYDRY